MDLSIEYISGFFDGEGFIGIYQSESNHKYQSYSLRVGIGQVDPTVVEWLHGHYGGSLRMEERSKKMKNRQDAWYWVISGRKAESFLWEVFPYLIGKKKQAELAFMFMAERAKPGQTYKRMGIKDPSPKYAKKMKELKRGVEVPLH